MGTQPLLQVFHLRTHTSTNTNTHSILSFAPPSPSFKMADNDAQHEHTFDSASAGASTTFPMQCSALRKNGFVVIKNRPCKIVEMSTSKTGKHGHAKVHLVAIDVFTGKKYEDICPSTHNMNVPNVGRKDYQLVDIDDDFLSLMDDAGNQKDDLKIPDDDTGKQIKEYFNKGEDIFVTVMTAMGEEKAIGTKTATNKD